MAETSKILLPSSKKDADAVLPYARTGASRDGRRGALTAFKSAGGEIDRAAALAEMVNRGKSVPGGACGFWGACGAGVSTGMFVSIISGSTPLTVEPFALSHQMTASALAQIGAIGGPRCCKRDSFLAIREAIGFVKEALRDRDGAEDTVCRFYRQNAQCVGRRCPFSAANHL